MHFSSSIAFSLEGLLQTQHYHSIQMQGEWVYQMSRFYINIIKRMGFLSIMMEMYALINHLLQCKLWVSHQVFLGF